MERKICNECYTPNSCREGLFTCIEGWPKITTQPLTLIPKTIDDKATNPKDAIGCNKMPIHLWPETATILGCLGLLDGAGKYGRANWREAGVRASIYVDALRRHIMKWFEGEENDQESGIPHLGHALACLAIIVDAQACGKLNDDRQYRGDGAVRLLAELTPLVQQTLTRHADKAPHHYTIAENPSA